MPTTKGATLFEACLVSAIIGVLSVIALPSFVRAQQRFVLESTACEIRSELHRARILAITRNQDCRLRVTTPGSYVLECQTPDWVAVRLIYLPSGMSISANNRPEFHPMGNVGPMASITVWNQEGDRRKVIVSRSGRIRME
jgi:type II secretory pathway pseudopilin PulG